MPRTNDILTSGFKPTPFWWDAFAPTDEGSVSPPEKVDVAIVGSGYAGLNAALELARNGRSVVVLESEKFGAGASTRSAGHISSGSNLGKAPGAAAKTPMEKNLPPEKVHALLKNAGDAFLHLENLIESENIECSYERSGRFIGASTKAHYDGLARKVSKLNEAANAEIEMLPPERVHEEIVTDIYHGGMIGHRAGQLHPSLYYKGVLEACQNAGVITSAHAGVRKISGAMDDFTLETAAGQVKADQIVIATNGYTGDVTYQLKKRLMPIGSYMIATEELGENRVKALLPNLRTQANSARILNYFRPSPDRKRILFGGRVRFRLDPPEMAAPSLYKALTGVFPDIEGVKVSHAWTGNCAFTFDALPHIGTMEGLHYCLGCNGSGVATMTYLGHQTARRVLGDETCAFNGLDFPSRPFYEGKPWFLPVVGNYFRLRDRLDQWFD